MTRTTNGPGKGRGKKNQPVRANDLFKALAKKPLKLKSEKQENKPHNSATVNTVPSSSVLSQSSNVANQSSHATKNVSAVQHTNFEPNQVSCNNEPDQISRKLERTSKTNTNDTRKMNDFKSTRRRSPRKAVSKSNENHDSDNGTNEATTTICSVSVSASSESHSDTVSHNSRPVSTSVVPTTYTEFTCSSKSAITTTESSNVISSSSHDVPRSTSGANGLITTTAPMEGNINSDDMTMDHNVDTPNSTMSKRDVTMLDSNTQISALTATSTQATERTSVRTTTSKRTIPAISPQKARTAAAASPIKEASNTTLLRPVNDNSSTDNNNHHQPSNSAKSTNDHHQPSNSAKSTNDHHQQSNSAKSTNDHHHQPSNSAKSTKDHHQQSNSAKSTDISSTETMSTKLPELELTSSSILELWKCIKRCANSHTVCGQLFAWCLSLVVSKTTVSDENVFTPHNDMNASQRTTRNLRTIKPSDRQYKSIKSIQNDSSIRLLTELIEKMVEAEYKLFADQGIQADLRYQMKLQKAELDKKKIKTVRFRTFDFTTVDACPSDVGVEYWQSAVQRLAPSMHERGEKSNSDSVMTNAGSLSLLPCLGYPTSSYSAATATDETSQMDQISNTNVSPDPNSSLENVPLNSANDLAKYVRTPTEEMFYCMRDICNAACSIFDTNPEEDSDFVMILGAIIDALDIISKQSTFVSQTDALSTAIQIVDSLLQRRQTQQSKQTRNTAVSTRKSRRIMHIGTETPKLDPSSGTQTSIDARPTSPIDSTKLSTKDAAITQRKQTSLVSNGCLSTAALTYVKELTKVLHGIQNYQSNSDILPSLEQYLPFHCQLSDSISSSMRFQLRRAFNPHEYEWMFECDDAIDDACDDLYTIPGDDFIPSDTSDETDKSDTPYEPENVDKVSLDKVTSNSSIDDIKSCSMSDTIHISSSSTTPSASKVEDGSCEVSKDPLSSQPADVDESRGLTESTVDRNSSMDETTSDTTTDFIPTRSVSSSSITSIAGGVGRGGGAPSDGFIAIDDSSPALKYNADDLGAIVNRALYVMYSRSDAADLVLVSGKYASQIQRDQGSDENITAGQYKRLWGTPDTSVSNSKDTSQTSSLELSHVSDSNKIENTSERDLHHTKDDLQNQSLSLLQRVDMSPIPIVAAAFDYAQSALFLLNMLSIPLVSEAFEQNGDVWHRMQELAAATKSFECSSEMYFAPLENISEFVTSLQLQSELMMELLICCRQTLKRHSQALKRVKAKLKKSPNAQRRRTTGSIFWRDDSSFSPAHITPLTVHFKENNFDSLNDKTKQVENTVSTLTNCLQHASEVVPRANACIYDRLLLSSREVELLENEDLLLKQFQFVYPGLIHESNATLGDTGDKTNLSTTDTSTMNNLHTDKFEHRSNETNTSMNISDGVSGDINASIDNFSPNIPNNIDAFTTETSHSTSYAATSSTVSGNSSVCSNQIPLSNIQRISTRRSKRNREDDDTSIHHLDTMPTIPITSHSIQQGSDILTTPTLITSDKNLPKKNNRSSKRIKQTPATNVESSCREAVNTNTVSSSNGTVTQSMPMTTNTRQPETSAHTSVHPQEQLDTQLDSVVENVPESPISRYISRDLDRSDLTQLTAAAFDTTASNYSGNSTQLPPATKNVASATKGSNVHIRTSNRNHRRHSIEPAQVSKALAANSVSASKGKKCQEKNEFEQQTESNVTNNLEFQNMFHFDSQFNSSGLSSSSLNNSAQFGSSNPYWRRKQ